MSVLADIATKKNMLFVLFIRGVIFMMSMSILLWAESTLLWAEEIHTLQQGETVYQLSKQYGIPVEVLLEVNNISDPSAIPAGQDIEIPDEHMLKYKVKKGDTLLSIAASHNLTLYQLRILNRGISDLIKIDQIVMVPNTEGSIYNSSSENVASSWGNVNTKTSDTGTSTSSETSISNNSYRETNETKVVEKNNVDGSRTSIANSVLEKKVLSVSKKVISRKNVNSFGTLQADDLMKNSKSIGRLSDIWPVSGDGYLLQGKLPGMLIEGNENQPVLASGSGVVVYAALHTSFSNVVVIQGDDGIVYVYAGQKSVNVKQGERIEKGNVIGVLGVMPTLQRSMLYFSLWDKNKFLDPRKKIG